MSTSPHRTVKHGKNSNNDSKIAHSFVRGINVMFKDILTFILKLIFFFLHYACTLQFLKKSISGDFVLFNKVFNRKGSGCMLENAFYNLKD